MHARFGAVITAVLFIFSSSASDAASKAGTLSIGETSYRVSQSGKSVVVTINRTGGTSGAVSVFFMTAHQSAFPGDYTGMHGTLDWASGDASPKNFTVGISNARPFVGTKVFGLSIQSPTGGAALGSAASSVTIVGSASADHGSLALTQTADAVTQNSGSLTVSVKRTGGAVGEVRVGYASANATAHAGEDYTAVSGTLTWAGGDSSNKSFSVPISKTTSFAGTRAFAVAIAGPSGGAGLAAPSTAAVTISGSKPVAVGSSGAMGATAASRLLAQATFGPSIDTVNAAAGQSYGAWLSSQMAVTPSLALPSVPENNVNWYPFWLRNVVMGGDQLRQRVAFALSELFVISDSSGPLIFLNRSMAAWNDLLVMNAFGNFRSLLEQVTLSMQMGEWLSMYRNDKPNVALGIHADENYARESLQLFSIGLVKLNLDGSVRKDPSGNPIPTFSQTDVENLARVYTGWGSNPTNGQSGETAWQFSMDRLHPMVAYPDHHDTEEKTIIDGVVIPAGGTPASDLKTALDTIFNDPNVGPFIGRQLIQRLVNSNPSPAYVARVATAFNNDGTGVRGNLGAVIKAILTDPEATTVTGQGKLREPLLRTIGLWRAFNAADATGGIHEYRVTSLSTAIYAEAPLQSPSVFNFFRPDYQRAGALTDAGLVVPEFQITNENTLVLVDNQNLLQSYQYMDSHGSKHAGYQNFSEASSLVSTSVLLKTAEWEPLAATPSTLVDKLNLVFMQGQMSAAMKTSLVNYVTAIPENTPWNRVVEAAELIVDSPQYSIQR